MHRNKLARQTRGGVQGTDSALEKATCVNWNTLSCTKICRNEQFCTVDDNLKHGMCAKKCAEICTKNALEWTRFRALHIYVTP